MTRLFLRFYFGVVAILISAWLIQGYVFRDRSEKNARVVEQALSGGARLARDELLSAADFDRAMATVADRFDYPVTLFPLDAEWLWPEARERLRQGEVVLLGTHIALALTPTDSGVSPPRDDLETVGLTDYGKDRGGDNAAPHTAEGLLFGPLPEFAGPSQTEVNLGYGVVFLMAAIAIAVLLRPVVFQMRAVERTAAAIAGGDLSARIDRSQAPQDLALVGAFNSMADRTEALLRSQRELLQAVSHELRTPLARIRFAADLVETAKSEEERQTRLDAIDSATQKLDDLVGELLTYVRLESDQLKGQPENVDLSALFSELIDIHATLHPKIEFRSLPQHPPAEIFTDRKGLARAVENLLSNAARHAKHLVQVRSRDDQDGILIEVEDDGEGISSEDREKIFQPFVRLGDSGQTGSGLGLALVQRIAKRQGGTIEVGSSPLGGARFTLRWPK